MKRNLFSQVVETNKVCPFPQFEVLMTSDLIYVDFVGRVFVTALLNKYKDQESDEDEDLIIKKSIAEKWLNSKTTKKWLFDTDDSKNEDVAINGL